MVNFLTVPPFCFTFKNTPLEGRRAFGSGPSCGLQRPPASSSDLLLPGALSAALTVDADDLCVCMTPGAHPCRAGLWGCGLGLRAFLEAVGMTPGAKTTHKSGAP